MTTPSLPHLRDLAERATPGPWQWRDEYGSLSLNSLTAGPMQCVVMAEPCGTENSSVIVDDADAAFIAASREALPALISLVEQQAREIGELRASDDTTPCARCGKPSGYNLRREDMPVCDKCDAAILLETMRAKDTTITTLRAALAEALEIAEGYQPMVSRHPVHDADAARIAALKEHLK